jgi:hypothetical protein
VITDFSGQKHSKITAGFAIHKHYKCKCLDPRGFIWEHLHLKCLCMAKTPPALDTIIDFSNAPACGTTCFQMYVTTQTNVNVRKTL